MTRTKGQGGSKGRGNLHGRTDWAHLYIEDGWQITPSLKLDIGLRYEYNQNMTDANNNIAIINTLVKGGEIVIASDGNGQLSPLGVRLWSPTFLQALALSLPRRPDGTIVCCRRVLFGWRRASDWPGLCPTTRP